ncbi:glycosyl hydrolase 108 family protein [Sphingomonas aurantiaca]|uniref:glycosyl hydrolase 108 family protein n=1 Tax=Sphingomonas aurantiaca TaxID=185949 RepID=UPI00335A7A3D
MEDSSPALEVGFILNTEGAFAEMLRFSQMFDDKTADFVRQAAQIEQAAGGIRLGGATAQVQTFGNAASREMQTARIAMVGVEKAGERMVAQLERQNSTFGKTREEIRGMNAEFRATAAEQQGLTELAQRIRAEESALYDKEFTAARRAAQEARDAAEQKVIAAQMAAQAVEMEAQAVREAEFAYAKFQAHAKIKSREYNEQQAANEIAQREANAAAMRLEGLAADQLAREHAQLAAVVRGSHDAQVADAAAAEKLRMATDPLYAATKRLNAEIAESTRLYHAGATAPAEYARQQDVLNDRLRQSAIEHESMAGSARKSGGALKNIAVQLPDITQGLLTGQKPMQVLIQQGAQIFQVAQMAEGGLKGFAAEVGGLAVAFLPAIAVASVAGVALYRWKEQINDDAGMKKFAEGLGLTHKEMKKLGDVSVGTGDIVAGVWKTISDGLNASGSGKSIMDYLFSPDDAQQVQGFLASIYGTFTGTYAAIVELWSSISTSVSAYVSAAAAAVAQFFAPVVAAAEWAGNGIAQIFNAIYNRVAGWLKSIGSAISDFAGPILKAMGQSDAAVAVTGAGSSLGKAFGKGYKQGVATVVDGTNKFVADSATNAIAHAQDAFTKKANAIKADRTPKKTPVDKHAESLVRDAEAVEAQIRNLYKLADAYGVSGAAALIAEARVKAESKAIKQQADIEASVNRQVRLAIAQRVSDGAKSTAVAREQAAAQTAINAQVAAGLLPAARAAELVKDQIADTIDQTAQSAAQGMADAFGSVGSAIGDALTVMAGYYADQAKLQEAHEAAIRAAGKDQQRIDRENRLYSLRSSSQQIGAFGDMAAAAKGFFKEGSQGYKTLETAEKAFRLVQFALSVRAIAQDAIETGTKIANSAARIAVGATEAVVNAIKSLPFPLNIAAGAATVAALASIGVSIAGSFGGGGKNTLAPTNSGTGTVLGDTSAKSDSIKNAIDALKEVDTLTNTFAREMSASLKSIDSQIGGVASLVVRSGNIDASSGVTEGFKANAIGSVLSKIPVIGGILGGLFGSKTSVIGSGLYGGAQSVGDIMNGGFDASYYSDIEKKKKLFGLTTSTKYSTQYTGADAGLENQFTLILKSFNDAIASAAGPLGVKLALADQFDSVSALIPQKPAGERKSLWKSITGKVAPKAAGGIAAIALAMIASVITIEGGYVNHPADPGGETHMGITKAVAVQNGYTGPMRTLPRDVAESIYYKRYLVQPGYAALVPIDAAVTAELFDTTVNMGPARPSTWFQQSTNALCGTELVTDGRVGPGTIAAYRACQGKLGASNLCVATLVNLDRAQAAEYARLVRVNPKLKVFYKGWIAHRIGNVDRGRCKVATS